VPLLEENGPTHGALIMRHRTRERSPGRVLRDEGRDVLVLGLYRVRNFRPLPFNGKYQLAVP